MGQGVGRWDRVLKLAFDKLRSRVMRRGEKDAEISLNMLWSEEVIRKGRVLK